MPELFVQPESLTIVNDFKVALKGRLHESVCLKELMEADPDIDRSGFGSITVKLLFSPTETILSLRIFNTGSWKLSGGCPSNVANDSDLNTYINTAMCDISSWISEKVDSLRVCCLNGIVKLGKTKQMNNIVIECSDPNLYDNVMFPDYEKRGRRNSWKFYNGKKQITIGTEGNGQIFGCKSFDELCETAKHIIRKWRP